MRVPLRTSMPEARVVPGIGGDCRSHCGDPAAVPEMTMLRRIARFRVTIGFIAGVVVLWLAEPTWRTLGVGGFVAVMGEAIRIWAAGHLEKGREVTTSGPYAFSRHPLYVGSSDHRGRSCDRVGQRDRRRAGSRVPCHHADRRHSYGGGAPHRKVRRRLSGLSRRSSVGRVTRIQLRASEAKSRVSRRRRAAGCLCPASVENLLLLGSVKQDTGHAA